MEFLKDKDIEVLGNAYRKDDDLSGTHVEYQNYLLHKYKHSMDVVEVGIKLLNDDSELAGLSFEQKRDFALALLFHDYARARERVASSGEVSGIDHGVEGARDVLALGYTSSNIILPILVHSRIDEAFLESADEELEKRHDFGKLNAADKDFVYEMRKIYDGLSKQEKDILALGIAVVKDADKLANLKYFEDMMEASIDLKSAVISPEVKDDALSGRIVDVRYMRTMADQVMVYLAWVVDLRLKKSFEIARELNVLGRSVKYAREYFKESPQEEVDELVRVIEEYGKFFG